VTVDTAPDTGPDAVAPDGEAPDGGAPDGGAQRPGDRSEGAAADRRPGRHTARWIAGLVLVVMAAFIVLLATRPPATATEVFTPLLGKPAPALAGTTLSGGRVDLASYRGRWVWVNFFASWCPPCQQEQPALVTFAFQHRAVGDAALVAVVFDDTTGNARAFDVSTGATWPSVIDPGGQIALRYGVRGPPEWFLISPGGKVVAHLDGPVKGSDLDGQIAAARAAGL
jgi:cytochrome c biogenesis protein CcmG/thiol:disulfide interchange protein DsbE